MLYLLIPMCSQESTKPKCAYGEISLLPMWMLSVMWEHPTNGNGKIILSDQHKFFLWVRGIRFLGTDETLFGGWGKLRLDALPATTADFSRMSNPYLFVHTEPLLLPCLSQNLLTKLQYMDSDLVPNSVSLGSLLSGPTTCHVSLPF